MTALKKYTGLIGWILITALAGFIGALFTPGGWYATLVKPSFNPPNQIFPIVWPILYLCMAVAAWLIWKDGGFFQERRALKWFCVQLVLNAGWSWLFFGRHAIGTALAEIILLWISILFTMILFWQQNKKAGWLFLPYILWVSFALMLNFSIFQLN